MATALTVGMMYLLEANAATNQNWLAGGPGTINLDLFTEGTEYCKLAIPKKFTKTWSTGVQIMDPGGGGSVQIDWDKRIYTIQCTGIEASITAAENLDKFTMLPAHTGKTTYIPYYLVIKYGTTDYVLFTNYAGTRSSYCKGVVVSGSILWMEVENQTAIVQFSFRSVWSAA